MIRGKREREKYHRMVTKGWVEQRVRCGVCKKPRVEGDFWKEFNLGQRGTSGSRVGECV